LVYFIFQTQTEARDIIYLDPMMANSVPGLTTPDTKI